MNRTVNITFAPSLKTSIIHDRSFQQALSYGIMWGNSSHVEIHVDKEGHIGCSHQRERPSTEKDSHAPTVREQFFYMKGIYNATTDSYAFHS